MSYRPPNGDNRWQSTHPKYEKKEGFFENLTKPSGPPRANLK
jgi:hypothetical protein